MKPDTGDATVDAILHTAHRIRTSTDAALRQTGLSLSGYKLLRALADGDRSMREISEVLHVAARSVTDIVVGLEAREFVERRAHPTDGRVTMLHLTSSGTSRLRRARADAERVSHGALATLDEDERRVLCALLRRVLDQRPPDA